MPAMKELGFMAQAAATLRRSEYTALLIKWLDDNLSDVGTFVDKSAPWHLRDEFALTQSLMAIAQLSAGDPQCMEIIRLAKIEEKVAPILEQLGNIQISQANESFAHLLPPLLWASTSLSFTPNEKFTPNALNLALRNLEKIPYSSKVLLSQVCKQLRESNYASELGPANVAHLAEMLYRYEQIEMRDNMREYKHLYGVDLALELQNAIKYCGLLPNDAIREG